MFAPDAPGIDLYTLPRPRILKGSDRPTLPVRDTRGDYIEHLEAELTARIEREAKLVAELEQLTRRFGVALPGWVGGRDEPRPVRRHRPSSPARTNARTGAALLGRLGRTPEPVAGLASDPATGRILLDGRPVHLTPIERLLLAYLLDRPGRLVSRAELVRAGWGYDVPTRADLKRLCVNVNRLRVALTKAGWTGSLTTEPNLGYVLEAKRP